MKHVKLVLEKFISGKGDEDLSSKASKTTFIENTWKANKKQLEFLIPYSKVKTIKICLFTSQKFLKTKMVPFTVLLLSTQGSVKEIVQLL